jgi:Acetyltransferase (GNAT) domain
MPDANTDAGLSIEWYDSDPPSWVDAELSRIYQNIYSLIAYHRSFEPSFSPSVYVVRRDGTPVDILIFTRTARRIDVKCFQARIGARAVADFARAAFARFPSVRVINVLPIYVERTDIDSARMPAPFQIGDLSEDYLLSLPDSEEAYLQTLGASTRKMLKRRLRLLRQDHPSLSFTVQANAQVDPGDIGKLVSFAKTRMQANGMPWRRAPNFDAGIERLAPLCVLGTSKIDGALAAGQLAFVIGSSCCFELTSHDPKFADYSIGTVNIFLTVCECIKLGVTDIHFLIGDSGYKQSLGAIRRPLVGIAFYRNHMAVLTHPRTYIRFWLQANDKTIRGAVASIPGLKRAVRALRAWRGRPG